LTSSLFSIIQILFCKNCALTVGSLAQEIENFTFYNDLDRVDTNVDPLMVPNHYLGLEIGLKTYLPKGLYTEVEEGNEINPFDKTIVFKPAFCYFNSIFHRPF